MRHYFNFILHFTLKIPDNHVIKYIPPEEFDSPMKPVTLREGRRKKGCLLVGAESGDPSLVSVFVVSLFNLSLMK